LRSGDLTAPKCIYLLNHRFDYFREDNKNSGRWQLRVLSETVHMRAAWQNCLPPKTPHIHQIASCWIDREYTLIEIGEVTWSCRTRNEPRRDSYVIAVPVSRPGSFIQRRWETQCKFWSPQYWCRFTIEPPPRASRQIYRALSPCSSLKTEWFRRVVWYSIWNVFKQSLCSLISGNHQSQKSIATRTSGRTYRRISWTITRTKTRSR